MARLGNPLVYNMLELADELARARGTPNHRKAAMRRAVSTAYYAVFHALCFVCASALVGWSQSENVDPIYRSVEHGFAKKRLASRDAVSIGVEVVQIGASFTALQDRRHSADYASPGLPVSPSATIETVELARQTVAAVEALDERQRLRLAILLIARQRHS